jgi:type IV pilus assembly protein PilB
MTIKSPAIPLGQLLLRAGRITPADLKRALSHKREVGLRLGQALVDLGYVDPEEITEALREQGKLNCITLRPEIVDREVTGALSESYCREHALIAVNSIAGITTVAMQDPADVYVIDEVSRTLGTRVFPVYAAPGKIEESIAYAFNRALTSTNELEEIVGNAGDSDIILDASPAEFDVVEDGETQDGPVINVIQAILKEAFDARASDIHLEPRDSTFVVRFRVDGSLYDRMTLEKGWAKPCLARLKVISNLDIAQKRLPQDGRTQVSVEGSRIDLRVSTMPTLLGEGAVVRILDGGRSVKDIASLGLRPDQETRLRSIVQNSDGVVLAVGPTGSGKATTLYALLDSLNCPGNKIITLEDPVENRVESICQINTNAKAGLTFARGLRSILRQDPDIVLVGEIRDNETAQIAVQAALTGHLVLSTLHTIGAAETITRMREMGVEHYLLSDTIRGIVAQRLLRKLCPHCKEHDEANYTSLNQVGIDRDTELFKAIGCERCNHTGFLGRFGVCEILTPTPEFRDALRGGSDVDEIRRLACDAGMMTLRQEGLRYAKDGITTIEEVLAITPRS